jgi:hypothetical protein
VQPLGKLQAEIQRFCGRRCARERHRPARRMRPIALGKRRVVVGKCCRDSIIFPAGRARRRRVCPCKCSREPEESSAARRQSAAANDPRRARVNNGRCAPA